MKWKIDISIKTLYSITYDIIIYTETERVIIYKYVYTNIYNIYYIIYLFNNLFEVSK